MIESREAEARRKTIEEFERKHPDYPRLETHPQRELIEWAYQNKLSAPVVVAGTRFVAPGTVEQARMWKAKLKPTPNTTTEDITQNPNEGKDNR